METHKSYSMYLNKKELTLLYNSSRELDRKTLAMAHTLGVNINRQDLNHARVSETLFMMFLNKLQMEPKHVLDRSNTYYQQQLRGKDYTSSEWYEIILRNPILLRAPLAMYRDKAIMCTSPNDMLRIS